MFHIDEDAYNLLYNYLFNLRAHFRREPGAEEIVHDMEQRVAELFADRLAEGRQVVTIGDVEAVIARMGRPDDLPGGEAPAGGKAARRLFRDPDDKVLGGVASGLSAYLGWDATWTRLGLVALFLLVPSASAASAAAYVLAWFIIPQARTAAEKLAMRGEAVNLGNIGRTVVDGYERANSYVRSGRPRGLLRRAGEGLVAAAGFLVKLLLVLLAVCAAPVLLALLAAFFALLLAAAGVAVAVPAALASFLPPTDYWTVADADSTLALVLAVCGILVIGIPVVGLVHLLMRRFGGWMPMSAGARATFAVLWLAALAAGAYCVLHMPVLAPYLSL